MHGKIKLSYLSIYEVITMLSQATKQLWAKKKNEEGNELWLPLITHLNDTANVINYLFNHWLNEHQRIFLRAGLKNDELVSEEEIQKLIKFLGFVHDIGKATPVFQIKKSYRTNKDDDLDDFLIERLIRVGFTGLDSTIILNANKNPHALVGEVILGNLGVSENIGAIIGGHHGKTLEKFPKNQFNDYTKAYIQIDDSKSNNRVKLLWEQVQTEILVAGLEIAGYSDVSKLPQRIKKPQAVLLEGLLIMADWLASSEYLPSKQPLFPLISLDRGVDDIDSQDRFQNAIMNWEQTEQWQPQRIENGLEIYRKRWNFEQPRPVQAKMTEAIGNLTEPGIIIVEAPMGIGKTEIALVATEQLAGQTEQTGLFIGLPTQATTNAMFGRVSEWVKSLANESGLNYNIRLQHGKALFNRKYREIPHASTISDDEGADDYLQLDGQIVVNDWFSGKKTMLTDFVVGTIDHLLLMGLKQKHLFLRHLGFSGKVVVIDEVHAYSAYMSSYLKKALEWLGAYQVPVVILSATLPKDKRSELIERYLKGRYGSTKPRLAPNNWKIEQAYPLLTMTDADRLVQVTDFEEELGRDVKVARNNLSDEELITGIVASLSNGGVVGLIVNTVKRAQQLAQLAKKLSPQLPLMVIHSQFLATARAKQEERLQAVIGKKAKRPQKLLVIGTQVLEQSLDIDFDIMYTDIAPIDLILQRVGRLHRHNIKRPIHFEKPILNVLGIESYGNYGDANQYLYGLYLLKKTDYYLPNSINLPNDISPLVQRVYGFSEKNQEDEQFKEDYVEFKKKIDEKKSAAGKFQIGLPNLKNTSLHGWLDDSKARLSEERANAAVRDIEETIEVILTRESDSGDELLTGKKMLLATGEEIAEEVIRLPQAISGRNSKQIGETISKLEKQTLVRYPEWQNNSWLHGCLALRLDKSNQVRFEDYLLTYDEELGLIYEKS